MKFYIALAVLLFAPLFLTAQEQNLIERADSYFGKRHVEENYHKALELYKQAVTQTGNYEAYVKYARALAFQGRFMEKDEDNKEEIFTKCINAADKAMGLKEKIIEALFLKGMCHGERANVDTSLSDAGKARDLMFQVIEQNPTFQEGMAYTILGKIYHELPGWPISFGDDDKSIQFLRKALSISPTNRYNYLFLVEVLLNEGYEKEAKQKLEKVFPCPWIRNIL
jgi:tetratricopeptide (TPR) repeat protein